MKNFNSKLGLRVQYALGILLLCGFSSELHATEPLETDAGPSIPATAEAHDTSPIIAKTYGVKVIRRSNSNRTYLFEDPNSASPAVGRLLLLKRESEPVMAFRVLQSYPERQQFVAKRVRRYGEYRILGNEEVFRAIEKAGDYSAPAQSSLDRSEVRELVGGIAPRDSQGLDGQVRDSPGLDTPDGQAQQAPLPKTEEYDPELDAGTSPPPLGAINSDAENLPISDLSGDDEEALSQLVAEEIFPIEHHTHSLAVQIAFLKNFDSTGAVIYPKGVTFRYGLTFGRMVFIRKPRMQDALTGEFGVSSSKLQPYRGGSESYTLLPMFLNLQYRIAFSQSLSLFIYGGSTKSRVLYSSEALDEDTQMLSQWIMNYGVGLNFRMGPNWDARVDLGVDQVAFGLGIKF